MAKLKFDPSKTLAFADPRETPTYGIPEAAHYLRIPAATLRSWVLGRFYETESGRRRFDPLLQIADPKNHLLSFINLAEAHVLSACRRSHQIRMDSIRAALDFVAKELGGCDHPLIAKDFETDGVSLFVTHYGKLIDASAHGQEVMRGIVQQYLKRLERKNDQIVRLYPFTRSDAREDSPKSVFIDPKISFGRLVLAAAGVATAALAERLLAGESIEHLAEDYGCEISDVQEAIRCEIRILDAAA